MSDKAAASAGGISASASASACHPTHTLGYHSLTSEQIVGLRAALLSWYDTHRRKMPWRGDDMDDDEEEDEDNKKVTAEQGQGKENGRKVGKRRKQQASSASTGKKSSKSSSSTLFNHFHRLNQHSSQDDKDEASNHHSATLPNVGSSDACIATAAADSGHAANSDSDAVAASTSSASFHRRHPVSAYGVWVSEVMAQQTRIDVVRQYWTRWMARFPTVDALSKASIDEVNAMWAGLGYYRRAKLLHQGAKTVMEKYDGKVRQAMLT